MKIYSNSWHARVFQWHHRQKYGWATSGGNLCPYIRTVFLWAPLRWLFRSGKVWKIPVPAIVIPFLLVEIPRWAGMVNYNLKVVLYIFEVILTSVASVVGAIAGICYLVEEHEWKYRILTVLGKTAKTKPVTKISEVIRAYWRAIHDRVCPFIEFKEEQ